MWIRFRDAVFIKGDKMTLHEYYCEVEDLLDNALNDLTSKDFDNLLAGIAGILSMLLDYSDEDKDE